MMTTDKKLAFLHKMAKLGMDAIPHFDAGGAVPNPNTGVFGTIGGALGLNNNYQAGSAPIQQGTNAAQIGASYNGAQTGLTNQNNLVTQTQPGVTQGIGAQSTLSGQLSAEANGQGPNPAQTALNQSTGQNIQQQAALAAGTRGAAANPGMIATQAAQQGAATQQQAVGQAATLEAQQQIAAQQQQQQLAATQVGQGTAAVQGENQAQQGEQGVLQGANTSANNAAVSQQSNINNVNAQTSAGNAAMAGNIFGGIASGASSAISSLFAEGGEVTAPAAPKKMAAGGYMAPTPLVVAPAGGPQSFVGQWVNSGGGSSGGSPGIQSSGPTQMSAPPSFSQAGSQLGSAIGDAASSPKEAEQDPAINQQIEDQEGAEGNMQPASGGLTDMPGFQAAAKGGKIKKPMPMMPGQSMRLISRGGPVKAENAKEKSVTNKDSYANDKVPALLSSGEVVMDKDTLNDPGPIGQMARTVAHHIASRNSNQKGMKRV